MPNDNTLKMTAADYQATASEQSIERAAIQYAQALGCIPAKIPNELAWNRADHQSLIMQGIPDVVLALPSGRVWWVEFKRPGERLSDTQAEIHHRLAKLGHDVTVCDNVDQFRKMLDARMP